MIPRYRISKGAILFDLDGTLLNTFDGITKSVIHALQEMGVGSPPEQEDLKWLIGPPLEASFAKLMGTADPNVVNECMHHYRARYEKQGLFESYVYPGVAEALDELSRNYQIYLATAKPQIYGYQALEHFNLVQHFTAVHGSDFDGARTEKEELIEHVLRKERLHVDAALMVGDRKYDVLGAKANGVTSVGVSWGFGTLEELRDAGADHICEKPAQIIKVSQSEIRTLATADVEAA